MLIGHAVVLLCAHRFFDVSAAPQPVLFVIFYALAVVCYGFFVVNDHTAKQWKGRFMALGFLLAHFSYLTTAVSFVWVLPVFMTWLLIGGMLLLSFILGGVAVIRWTKQQKKIRALMLHESLTDELTSLFNRRAFARNSKREMEFSEESNSALSVMILDIDDFKPVNDLYGHPVGDLILIELSRLFRHYLRKSDSVYRWGGEEFVFLLPVTGLFEANQVAQKISRVINRKPIVVNDELSLSITASIGVAQWLPNESISKDTLSRADQALYKAKSKGKNAVVVADYQSASHNPQRITG